MPDRLVREGAKLSRRVNALSDTAECLFWRLILTVDVNGVYHAEPPLVKAACWPAKSIRLSDVARVLSELERAGLIASWTAKDDARYLCLLKFRQRLRYTERPRFPVPPFDLDSGDQGFLELTAVADPPDPPPRPPARGKRREEKRSEVCVSRPSAEPTAAARPRPDNTHTHDEFQKDWISRLAAQWPGVAIQTELANALAYVRKQRGPLATLSREFFEQHWLPGCRDAVDLAALKAPCPVATEDLAPEGWEAVIADTKYGPGGAFAVNSWQELSPQVRDWIRKELITR